jgi:hypothetical protein
VEAFAPSCQSCTSGYYSSTGAAVCTACGTNSYNLPNNPLPSNYHVISARGLKSTCRCSPGYFGTNCQLSDCDTLLPAGSLLSLLINAEKTFMEISASLVADPLNQDIIAYGTSYLISFLKTDIDFNGNKVIDKQEVLDALQYRSVEAIGLENMDVWNCQDDVTGCFSNSVTTQRILNNTLSCFLNSLEHTFDCSGVSVIASLTTTFPKSDNIEVCKLSDQTWYPLTHGKPFTSWTFTSTGLAQLGVNGKVCVYSNGINIQGAPFNTIDIAEGTMTNFTDPNNNGNVTGYRRVYCIAVLLDNGSYGYTCSSGLFHVSYDFIFTIWTGKIMNYLFI